MGLPCQSGHAVAPGSAAACGGETVGASGVVTSVPVAVKPHAPLGRIVRPADYERVLGQPIRLRSPHFAIHHLEGAPLPARKPPHLRPVPGVTGVVAEVTDVTDDAADTPSVSTGHAPVAASLSTELSTGGEALAPGLVDDLLPTHQVGAAATGVMGCWLGLVVPKRHAKRAVTRNLIKRQARHIAAACAGSLPAGLWVVRVRSPFDAAEFTSARSERLRLAARAELLQLFERACRGERDPWKPKGPWAGKPRKSGKAGHSGKAAKPAATPDVAAASAVTPAAPEATPPKGPAA